MSSEITSLYSYVVHFVSTYKKVSRQSEQVIFSPLKMHHCACIKYFFRSYSFRHYICHRIVFLRYIFKLFFIFTKTCQSEFILLKGRASWGGGEGHGKDNHGPWSNIVYICIIMDVSSNKL